MRILGLTDSVPSDAEELGLVKIGDSGFSTDCGWEVVIDHAKTESRKVGGNVLKIIEHRLPDMVSSCHRIVAKIYKVNHPDSVFFVPSVDSSLSHPDYALLRIYRNSSLGALVSYKLYLGDSLLCGVDNRTKKEIHIKKAGSYVLWARTEVKEELPIDIELGKVYYIRCGVSMGVFVGRPVLDLVENAIGKDEFSSIHLRKVDCVDIIATSDGRMIDCIIDGEDAEYIYYTFLENKKEVQAKIKKTEVKWMEQSK